MKIRPEHILYTEEQIANMTVILTNDDDPEAPSIAMHNETGQLAIIARRSYAAEDERQMRINMETLRIDWLGVLGYDYNELGFNEER